MAHDDRLTVMKPAYSKFCRGLSDFCTLLVRTSFAPAMIRRATQVIRKNGICANRSILPEQASTMNLSAEADGRKQLQPGGHSYRPDIDGLRAIAVLLVILYHADLVAPLTGGFIGVDVFFVISGFLITSIIHQEIKEGTYSILRFYERRVRRIFPALIVIVALCCLIGYFTFPPRQLRLLAASAFSAVGFYSNHFFLSISGYFQPDSAQLPLLHTWSLAVEEQFYLLMPLLLWLLTRRSALVERLGLFAVLLISFALSVWMVGHEPNAAFYVLPSRAWELMVGSLLATQGALAGLRNRLLNELLGAAGLLLIIGTAFIITSQTPFPGWAAVPPCLGAAAIIHAGATGTNWTKKLLSLPFMTATGRISYSLYLWHWPVLAFLRYSQWEEPSVGMRWGAVVAIFILATLSWAFVEQPFRRPAGVFNRRGVFAAAALAMLVSFSFNAVMRVTHGLPSRFAAIPDIVRNDDLSAAGKLSCADLEWKNSTQCAIGAADKAPSFLVWGDSHANRSVPAFAAVAKRLHISGIAAYKYGCPPLQDFVPSARLEDQSCPSFNAEILKLIAEKQIGHVFLVAAWAPYVEKPRKQGGNGDARLLKDDAIVHDTFRRAFSGTIQAVNAAGARVTIVAAVPEVSFDVPTALVKKHVFGSDPPDMLLSHYLARQKRVFAAFDEAKGDRVDVIYPHELLCNAEVCAIEDNGSPLYFDDNHLTHAGARKIEPLIETVLP